MWKIFESVVLPVAALALCMLLAGTTGFYRKKALELEAAQGSRAAQVSNEVTVHSREIDLLLLDMRNKCLEHVKALMPIAETGSVLDRASAINRICPVVDVSATSPAPLR